MDEKMKESAKAFDEQTAKEVATSNEVEERVLKPEHKKPGMVLVTTGMFGSSGDKAYVGHAVIIGEDTDTIIEAVSYGKGSKNEVIKNNLSDFINDNPEFYVVWPYYNSKPVADSSGVNAARYAKEQLGKPYNKEYYCRETVKSFYCSQLCWRSWLEQGYKLDWDETGPEFLHCKKAWVSPNDLIRNRINAHTLYKVNRNKK